APYRGEGNLGHLPGRLRAHGCLHRAGGRRPEPRPLPGRLRLRRWTVLGGTVRRALPQSKREPLRGDQLGPGGDGVAPHRAGRCSAAAPSRRGDDCLSEV
ncbi:MAG: hypothetical protein AVDCRST_MAG45-2362, partial [uncultured Solirubrobacterales bacterium]